MNQSNPEPGDAEAAAGQAPAEAAFTLSAEARESIQAASILLGSQGIGVTAGVDAASGQPVLTLRVLPRANTQYDQVLSDMNAQGSITPRLRTGYASGRMRATLFDPAVARPMVRVEGQEEGAAVEVFGPRGACLSILSENSREADGGAIEISVLDPEAPLFFRVGEATYRVADGELVRET